MSRRPIVSACRSRRSFDCPLPCRAATAVAISPHRVVLIPTVLRNDASLPVLGLRRLVLGSGSRSGAHCLASGARGWRPGILSDGCLPFFGVSDPLLGIGLASLTRGNQALLRGPPGHHRIKQTPITYVPHSTVVNTSSAAWPASARRGWPQRRQVLQRRRVLGAGCRSRAACSGLRPVWAWWRSEHRFPWLHWGIAWAARSRPALPHPWQPDPVPGSTPCRSRAEAFRSIVGPHWR